MNKKGQTTNKKYHVCETQHHVGLLHDWHRACKLITWSGVGIIGDSLVLVGNYVQHLGTHIQNIALNMAEYGLPIREFEHGILFILK